jgi:lysophospholipase L1-like esterase
LNIHRIVFVFTLLLTSCGSGGSVGNAPVEISVFGDSTTYGAPSHFYEYAGQRLAVPWPSYMEQIGGVIVKNYGRNGMTALQLKEGSYPGDVRFSGPALAPFRELLDTDKNPFIVIDFGINEARSMTEVDEFRATIISLVEIARETNRKVFLKEPNALIEMVRPDGLVIDSLMIERRKFLVNVLRDVGKLYEVPVIRTSSVTFELSVDIWDGIHPNQEYAKRIGKKTYDCVVLKLADC